jgi:hypothetical protein
MCRSQGHLIRLFFFLLVLSICFLFSGIWGFLCSNSFFNYLSQESAIVIADAEPAMSYEALGALQ